jgi:phosphate/sulfate permease
MSEQGTVVGALTDGTGVSPMTAPKFIKDFVADVLLSGAAALAAAQVMDVGSAIQTPEVATFALIGAVIRAGYRAALRWATTD